MRNWLSGYKTYIVGITTIWTAVGGYASGEIDIVGLVGAILAAAGVMSLRAGIK